MKDKAVLDLAKKRGRDKIFFAGVWRGFNVYGTDCAKPPRALALAVGTPLVILEKDGKLEAVDDFDRVCEISAALVPDGEE